jgi:hypothetical protein
MLSPLETLIQMGMLATRHHERKSVLQRFLWLAFATHEHLFIDQFFENAYGPELMQAAFVATDGGHAACIFEG